MMVLIAIAKTLYTVVVLLSVVAFVLAGVVWSSRLKSGWSEVVGILAFVIPLLCAGIIKDILNLVM
jgi:hypothetical protein